MKNANEPLAPPLRARFIALRTALVQRGIFNPTLGRFDSFTSPRATAAEIAAELAALAETRL